MIDIICTLNIMFSTLSIHSLIWKHAFEVRFKTWRCRQRVTHKFSRCELPTNMKHTSEASNYCLSTLYGAQRNESIGCLLYKRGTNVAIYVVHKAGASLYCVRLKYTFGSCATLARGIHNLWSWALGSYRRIGSSFQCCIFRIYFQCENVSVIHKLRRM